MRAYHLGMVVLVALVWAAAAPAASVVSNGQFDSGLSDWATVGPVSDGGGFALIEEDLIFALTRIEQEIVIPDEAQTLSFDYAMTSLAGGPTGSPLPDAWFAYLLDPVTFAPILSTPGYDDYFYHDNGGFIDYDPSIVNLSGGTVTLNLASIPGGTPALVSFELWGGNDGYLTEVTLDNVEVQTSVIPEPLTLIALPMALAGIGRYVRRRSGQAYF